MMVRALQNDTLDLLCWRHLGQTAGAVEQTLALNPGIGRLGVFLPLGQAVRLPDRIEVTTVLPMINLWD